MRWNSERGQQVMALARRIGKLRDKGLTDPVIGKELGIHPSTLYRKMRDLGIDTPETDGRTRQP